MLRHRLVWVILGTVVTLLGMQAVAHSQPEGQLVIAFDTTIASSYLDPAETTGLAAPFVFLYALHDALVKPLPGNHMAPAWRSHGRRAPMGWYTNSSCSRA